MGAALTLARKTPNARSPPDILLGGLVIDLIWGGGAKHHLPAADFHGKKRMAAQLSDHCGAAFKADR